MTGGQLVSAHRTMPFPEVLNSLGKSFGLGALSLRPFGLFKEDRDVDFDQASRPFLETEILRCCTHDRDDAHPAPEFFWELAVSMRTQCLLMIAAMSDGSEELSIDLKCPSSDCRGEMEIEFSLADLQPGQGNGNELIEVSLGAETLVLRTPTGKDQREWLAQAFEGSRAVVQAMVETLVVGHGTEPPWAIERLGEEDLCAIADALTASDPLVNFSVRARCPDCATEAFYPLDLGAVALDRLRRAQDRLLRLVHTLASRYHWTEEQILELPPWRRSRYLTFIERDEIR